jgi:hypothetical protein
MQHSLMAKRNHAASRQDLRSLSNRIRNPRPAAKSTATIEHKAATAFSPESEVIYVTQPGECSNYF